jgi:hypothetical protein
LDITRPGGRGGLPPFLRLRSFTLNSVSGTPWCLVTTVRPLACAASSRAWTEVPSHHSGRGAGRARVAEAARYSCPCELQACYVQRPITPPTRCADPCPSSNPLGFDLILCEEQAQPVCPVASCPRPSQVPTEPVLFVHPQEVRALTSHCRATRGRGPHPHIWTIRDPASRCTRDSKALPGDGCAATAAPGAQV